MVHDYLPYSYHTFLYPFRFDAEECDSFIEDLKNAGWNRKITVHNEDRALDKGNKEAYRIVQYFNESARRGILGASGKSSDRGSDADGDKDFCRVFSLREDLYTEHEAEYVIKKRNKKQNKDEEQRLTINDVQLMVYDIGVAVLVFETEYYGARYTKDTYTLELKDGTIPQTKDKEELRKNVRWINEYGRRLYPQYLSENCDICPDSISIVIDGNEQNRICDDLTFKDNAEDKEHHDHFFDKPFQLPRIIIQTLNGSILDAVKDSSYTASKYKYVKGTWSTKRRFVFYKDGNAEAEERYQSFTDKYDIRPAVDDRMFVCCCICDQDYTEKFLGHPAFDNNNNHYDVKLCQQHEWEYLSDWETGLELYGLINIDCTGSSCQNRVMLDQYLNDQLYTRWIEYGTIQAVTNHSAFCLTGCSQVVENTVIDPFLILYVRLCAFCLAGRAALLKMDDELSDAARKFASIKETKTKRAVDPIDTIADLEKKYSVLQAELLLSEVTPQIQGIEIYEKLRKMLFIDELKTNIRERMDSIYQISEAQREQDTADRERKINAVMAGIGFLSGISVILDITEEISSPSEWLTYLKALSIVGILVGVIVIPIGRPWFKKKRMNKRNQKRRKERKNT